MIPIRVRQFPAFVKEAVKRTAVLRKPAEVGQTFHLCYFSCHSYFSYLYCSLHSMTQTVKAQRYKIWIFNDADQPLSAAQIQAIQDLIPDTEVILWPKSMGWGAAQIATIWQAYKLAAKDALDTDIIARIDSDVFFFNDTIFKAVARTDADLVGDGHFVDFRYCQGGCYFFKAKAVRRIVSLIETEGIETLVSEMNVAVEDVAAHHFAKRLRLKIWLTWFMMFPDELKNAHGLTPWYRWKFSCLHFVMKNKAAMLVAYENNVLMGSSHVEYRQRSNTS